MDVTELVSISGPLCVFLHSYICKWRGAERPERIPWHWYRVGVTGGATHPTPTRKLSEGC